MISVPAPIPERRLFAIGIVLTTYIFFTLCDVAAKWMVVSGIPPLQVAFARYMVQFAFMLGLALPQSGLKAFRSGDTMLMTIRGAALLGMTALNFFALLYLPLTLTSTIMFSIPLLVTALSVPFLGEDVGWRRWLAIGVGFAGILVIVQPWDAQFHWAVILSLGCSFCGAFYFILTRKLAGRASSMAMQLYGGGVGAIALLPFALMDWVWPDGTISWMILLSIGVAAMIGHQISIAAHRLAPASVLAPFGYTQIIWMSVASWWIFAEPPTMWLYIGAPIVIGSGLYIWLRERKLAKPVVTPVAPQAADGAEPPEAQKEQHR